MQFKKYDAKLFKYQRRVLGITAQELADICRCTRQTIRNVENGTNRSESMTIVIGLALEGLAKERGVVFDGNTIKIL